MPTPLQPPTGKTTRTGPFRSGSAASGSARSLIQIDVESQLDCRAATPAPNRSDPAALPGVAVGDDRRPIKRFLNTSEAADYVGLIAKTLGR